MGTPKVALWLSVICLLTTVGVLTYGGGRAAGNAPVVLRAQRIELVDSGGKLSGSIGASPDGLEVRDASGKMMAILGTRIDCVPRLGIFNEHGGSQFSVNMSSDGDAELSIGDASNKSKVSLGVFHDGYSALSIRGKDRAGTNLTAGTLAAYDADHKVIWSIPEGAVTTCPAAK